MKELELNGNVGESITADSIKTFLNNNKGQDITFNISTFGGSLNEAIIIYNYIKSHSGKTIANLVGFTASAGTVIATACDEITMLDNSLFLIHNSSAKIEGNTYDFQKTASDLMKNDAIMVKIYKDKTGLSESEIISLMRKEDWLSPDEAKNYGFIDKIIPSNMKIAAYISYKDKILLEKAINKQLIIKLETKMKNIFSKKDKPADQVFVHALKDGQFLANAETLAEGVEVAPVGALSLEDGEYELADGRKISIMTDENGVQKITLVEDVAAPEAVVDTEALIASVTKVVVDEIGKIRAEFDEKLGKISSQHKPAKGTLDSSKEKPKSVTASVNEITGKIRENIVASRKA